MNTLNGTDDMKHVHTVLQRSTKALILTGAGISTGAGIPDFRSTSGLYKTQHRGLSGKDLFDVSLFQQTEHIAQFARFMAQLQKLSTRAQPTRTHRFIQRQLANGRAVRCYTQNIDGLERKSGLVVDTCGKAQCVQLHGDLGTLRCSVCSYTQDWGNVEVMSQGLLEECPQCLENKQFRAIAGKRTGGLTTGHLRPNIVLYGEEHPHAEAIALAIKADLKTRPDLLLIVGTSLRVHGVKQLVRQAARAVHARGGQVILINSEPLKGWDNIIDHQVVMDAEKFFKSHESHTQQLLSPPTTPQKKRPFADVTNISPSPLKKR